MLSSEQQGAALIGRVSGRLDEMHWESFAEALKAAVDDAGRRGLATLVLDLSAVEYISSRGLRALTIGKRQAADTGVAILLAAPNGLVGEILAISRYDKLFPLHDTVEAALGG